MKTHQYIVLVLCILLNVACAKENIMEEIPQIPTQPDTEKPADKDSTTIPKNCLNIQPNIENVQTRAIVENWENDMEMAVISDSGKVKFTYNNKQWIYDREVDVKNDMPLKAYFPYSAEIIKSASGEWMQVDATTQTDYMYGQGLATEKNPVAQINMKHALACIRICVKKNDYQDKGVVENINVNNLDYKGQVNINDGYISLGAGITDFKVGGNYTLDDNNMAYSELIVMPVGYGENRQIELKIDGTTYIYEIPENHKWTAGTRYTYTLNLKGYNCPTTVDHVDIDVEYWSRYGKDDKMIVREAATDYITVQPNYTKYGYDTYTGEGKVFGFYFWWADFANFTEIFEGEARFTLQDDKGNIIEQYQPFDVKCDGWGGYGRNCYIQAKPGIYKVVPLFRKKGETTWFKAQKFNNNGTDEEWKCEVKPKTEMPALRWITTNVMENVEGLVLTVPFNKEFGIIYTLSNPSLKPIKGTIKAMWEREFKLYSNSYRPSSKKPAADIKSGIDEEFNDEIGRVEVDIPQGIRFWKGLMNARFTVKREKCLMNDGGTYAGPITHLYFRQEGTTEWVLLRLDADYMFNKDVSYNVAANRTINYINIEPDNY